MRHGKAPVPSHCSTIRKNPALSSGHATCPPLGASGECRLLCPRDFADFIQESRFKADPAAHLLARRIQQHQRGITVDLELPAQRVVLSLQCGRQLLALGKSNSTKSRFLALNVLKSAFAKISLSILTHQLHQSDPVKSKRICFLSAAACVFAASKSSSQPGFAARASALQAPAHTETARVAANLYMDFIFAQS
jgi:hypothetical protein